MIKLIVVVSIAAAGYLAFGSTTSVSIDRETCEPKGFVAFVRRAVNPGGFYKDQIHAIDNSIQNIYTTMASYAHAQNYQKSVSPIIASEVERKMEEIHQKYPSLRPSPAGVEAQRLRKEAELIEAEENETRTRSWFLSRIAKLENCRSNLALKIK